jgi:outer membrane receptor protein involved in Fe transport
VLVPNWKSNSSRVFRTRKLHTLRSAQVFTKATVYRGSRGSLSLWARTVLSTLVGLFFVCPLAAQTSSSIAGIVTDSFGSPIANALIQFESSGGTIRTKTNATGEFVITVSAPEGMVTASSAGFISARIKVSSQPQTSPLHLRLDPAPIIQRLEVRVSGDRLPAIPESKYEIGRHEIEGAGALTIDEILRRVPGFSLFRRSGSLSANPTSQGVSLRGVGANGASRAVVLLDGIPLNTPFGGWIYWQRVPQASIESIEVFNGANSEAYGSAALGGVINLRTRATATSHLTVEASLGNESTPDASFFGSRQFGRWGLSLAGQALRTGGYILVPKDQRGLVDTPARTSDLAGTFTLSRAMSHDSRMFLRWNSFGESRRNGTPVQTNNTRITALDSGMDLSSVSSGDFSFRLFGSSEYFNQNFSAIALDRNTELLTNRQRNPSQQLGLVFQWRRAIKSRQSITAGFEGRDVRGHSAETTFSSSRPTAFVDAGGEQLTLAGFANDSIRAGRWLLSLGVRLDHWANTRGFSNRTPINGAATALSFPDRSDAAFSPKASLLRQFDHNFHLSLSLYKAFRAPTLNELYRNFRVGNVVTNANASLRAERFTGAEAGMSWQTFSERLTLRSNAFWNTMKDPVTNVTTSITPTVITRQRQNLGSLRARGLQVDANLKLARHWQLSSGYLLTDSTITRFPANLTLQGLRIPQIPKHQFNFGVDYSDSKWSFGMQGRFVGMQFDDDLNTLPLKRFFTGDAEMSRLFRHMKLFVAFQNLTGTRYEISRSPVLTVGPPLLIRLGARWTLH